MKLTHLTYEFCRMKKRSQFIRRSFILKTDEKAISAFKWMKTWPRWAHSAETVGERGRFAWGACLALWDLFVIFAVLTSRVSSSSLWMLSFFLRFFINSGALSALSSDPCGCLTCKTLVAKVH
jgi:hypothetical protein